MGFLKYTENFTYIIRQIAKRSPLFLWDYFRESLLFDLVNRTNTHLRIPKSETNPLLNTSEFDDGLLYVASFTSVVVKTLSVVEEFLGNKFASAQFIDFGCGKGKALLTYALNYNGKHDYPCIGIEYDDSLCEIAQENLVTLALDSKNTLVVCASAIDFSKYISTQLLIAYIYNSFQGKTFRSTLDELANYPHLLIYVDPAEEDILSEYGYKTLDKKKGKYNADTWLVAANQKVLNMV
jgi:hypothetical protein